MFNYDSMIYLNLITSLCAVVSQPKYTFAATKLSSSFLGTDEEPIKSMMSDLIREANDTLNGRLSLLHLEQEQNPPKSNIKLKHLMSM